MTRIRFRFNLLWQLAIHWGGRCCGHDRLPRSLLLESTQLPVAVVVAPVSKGLWAVGTLKRPLSCVNSLVGLKNI